MFCELGEKLRRHGRSARDAEAQRSEVVVFELFGKQHGQKQARHARDVRDPFLLDGRQKALHRKPAHQDDGASNGKRAQQIHGSAEGVEKRNGRQGAVRRCAVADGAEQFCLRAEILVGQNRAHGFAGEPRRVDHDGRIVPPERGRRRGSGAGVHDIVKRRSGFPSRGRNQGFALRQR